MVRLGRDLGQNGASSVDELFLLADLGIASIDLGAARPAEIRISRPASR